MRANAYKMIRLGDMIVAAFDEAAHYSSDPREVSRLATQMVKDLLRTARRALAPLSPSDCIEHGMPQR
jgi:hypothetical protein